jgi:hypothetical protein
MVTDIDIITADLDYPYLDFDVDTYLEAYADEDIDAEDVEQVVNESELLEWFSGGVIYITDWNGAMDALSEEMNEVVARVGKGNGFDRGFERAVFDVSADEQDTVTVDCVKNGRDWKLVFESEDIALRHQIVFEEDDEDIQEYSHENSPDAGWATYYTDPNESFTAEVINAHVEKLDHACYYIGGDDVRRDDVTHTVWIEPARDVTMLRYRIQFDE